MPDAVAPGGREGPVRAVPPEWVGRRVSVRHLLDSGSATDVVGLLRTHDGTRLVVERRDGTPADVSADRVVAARLVPPPAARRRPPPPDAPGRAAS